MKRTEKATLAVALAAITVSIFALMFDVSEALSTEAILEEQHAESRFQWAADRIDAEISRDDHGHINKGNERLEKIFSPETTYQPTNEYYQLFLAMALAADHAWRTEDPLLQDRAHRGMAVFHYFFDQNPERVEEDLTQLRVHQKLIARWRSDTEASGLKNPVIPSQRSTE